MGGKTKKKFLLDTSVIMDDPSLLVKFYENGKNEVYLTDVILSEIDKHKTSPNPELGFIAREFIRSIDIGSIKPMRRNVKRQKQDIISVAKLSIESSDVTVKIINRLNYDGKSDTNDMKILEIAKDYKLKLITNDASFAAIAASRGVPTESVLADSCKNPEEITFHKNIEVRDFSEIASLTPRDVGLSRWGQLTATDRNGRKGYFIANGTGFISLNDNFSDYTVEPINVEQKFYADILRNNDGITVVSGSTGSGKTLLALQEGIRRVAQKKVSGIVYMRYTVNAEDKFSALGYRKGDEDQKLQYYNYPLYGAINFLMAKKENQNISVNKTQETVKFMNKYNIEVLDIAHARGITITNKYVIFDELQNTPPKILKLIGTRLGKGSNFVLMGDFRQVDHPYLSKTRNSLVKMLNMAQRDDNVAGIILNKTVRSDMAEWFQHNT